MALPTSIGSASHFDQGSDDPKQARAQLKQIRDDIETINEHLKLSPFISPSTPLGIGDGLESSGGNARVQLQSNPGIARSSSGIALDINGITAETAPAVADTLAIYDATATAIRKMTLQNLLKVINSLTEDTAPDGANDFLLSYDASDSAVKKVKHNTLTGGWSHVSNDDWTSGVTKVITLDTEASTDQRLILNGLYPASDASLSMEVSDDGGSSYLTGVIDYDTGSTSIIQNNVPITGGVNVDSINNDSTKLMGQINFRLSQDAAFTIIDWWVLFRTAIGGPGGFTVGRAVVRDTSDITDVRFTWSSSTAGSAGTLTLQKMPSPLS